MKNNFLRTVAVIATVVALLATSMVSFAATANTVTTYANNKMHVVSTVSDVAEGVMVTYLATKEGTVASKDDIVYVDQKTSNGVDALRFEYDAATVKSAKILYGSNLSAVAGEMNSTDPATTAVVAGVEVTATGATCIVKNAAGAIAEYLGNTEVGTIEVTAKTGYEISAITINGEAVQLGAISYSVKSGDKVVVTTIKTVGDITVGKAEFGKVIDKDNNYAELDTKGLVCKINGSNSANATAYGVYAYRVVNGEEEPFELEPGTNGGYYEAVNAGTDKYDGYYAVQLASEDSLADVILVPYYAIGDVIVICR